jgi:tetratricopeptide (TPR) repeat protein
MLPRRLIDFLVAAGVAVVPLAGQSSLPGSEPQKPALPVEAKSFSGSNPTALPSTPAMVNPPLTDEMRGDIFMARKRYRDAIDMYRKGDPKSPVLSNKIGIAYHQMMDFNQARKNYEKAIRLKPDYPEAINNLGTIFYAQKSFRRAIGYYKRALRLEPNSASMMVNLGSAYFGRRDYLKASELYSKAMEVDPEVFERKSLYGELLQERSVDDRAKFHLELAKAYAKRNDSEHALIYLRKALEEGVKDRDKIPSIPEFAALRTETAFKELMASAPKPL